MTNQIHLTRIKITIFISCEVDSRLSGTSPPDPRGELGEWCTSPPDPRVELGEWCTSPPGPRDEFGDHDMVLAVVFVFFTHISRPAIFGKAGHPSGGKANSQLLALLVRS